jgi:tetratricopeptide (TPR) repeat protein
MALIAILIVLAGVSVTNADDGHTHQPQLGDLHFQVECNAEAQSQFNVTMAYYHSFQWQRVIATSDRVLEADPSCGMAHWAKMLAMLDNPFVWPVSLSEKAMTEGPTLLKAARMTGLKSQREHDYVAAFEVFFTGLQKKNYRERADAFEATMAQVAQRYPEDTEATILYALFLSANFDPADKQFNHQLQAATLLEPLFVKQPHHPGVAHYLIHSYDYPPIAHYGIEAARKYATIAPDAAHALHMPSHIFTLMGLWQESIETNRKAVAMADDTVTHDGHHASDYMVYAHLQLGQHRAARAVSEQERTKIGLDKVSVAYAYAAIPARIALERSAWQEAANLPLFPAPEAYPWKKYPQAEAVNAFARGVGSAMNGELDKGNVELNRLIKLRETAAAIGSAYWTDQIDIQVQVVQGLIVFAQGKGDEGLTLLRRAADREDASAKSVVTPGPILPAREILATALERDDKPVDALAEFEKVLERQPNRYRAMAGAAQTAKRANNEQKALYYAKQLLQLGDQADSPMPDGER